MPIKFNNDIFHIYNNKTSYAIKLSEHGDLLHMYWGGKIEAQEADFIIRDRASFSAYEPGDTSYSLDVLPQEYPAYGAQDMRTPAFEIETKDGSVISKPRYVAHKIYKGKPGLEGLPALYTEDDGEAETLEITLRDGIAGFDIILYYTIYENYNIICRHSEIVNSSGDDIFINSAASMSVDFGDYDYEYIHLHGAWAREKHIERVKVSKGFQGIDSKRGASGVCENPFIALMRPQTTEDFGDVYGFSFVYSGNFKMNVEVEQYDTMRVQVGINPHNFRWKLESGQKFVTPEVVMVYSAEGLGGMSRTYHDIYRSRLCRGKYRDKVRPILINNWEATYFDFNQEKLLKICDKASELGFELFVLDDGWFGKRNDDTSSLGDWSVNLDKLPDSISGLANEVNKRGLKFGLWVEPEMISKNSELYREHPDWAIQVPGRTAHEGRNQYIIDMSRDEIVDYLIDRFTDIFSGANIAYIKWDMNRNMTDIYSAALPADRQGEVAHRYILGVYKLMDALTSRFPDILFEGCSGGAGRNDPGVLYYMPQNWGSDDTDAVERMYIQYGASMVYPASSVCAHVSDVPNHQVGRTTPLKLRGDVAMSGSMGYEFDLSKLTQEQSDEIKEQIVTYKRIRETVMSGDEYRLIDPFEDRSCSWMFVSKDKNKAVVFYYNKLARPNSGLRRLKLKGLDETKLYEVGDKIYSGKTLMRYGLYLPIYEKDFESVVWEINA